MHVLGVKRGFDENFVKHACMEVSVLQSNLRETILSGVLVFWKETSGQERQTRTDEGNDLH